MSIPEPRQPKKSGSYIEERTFYSKDEERTYHVKQIDVGGGGSYVVSMEVVAKHAAEDILGEAPGTLTDENTRAIWDKIWKGSSL